VHIIITLFIGDVFGDIVAGYYTVIGGYLSSTQSTNRPVIHLL